MTKALDRFEGLKTPDKLMKAIAMLLWKNRYRNPELAVQVTEQDMEGFNDCTEYLKIKPEVRIFRPQGRPEVPAQPATAKRSAIPYQPAEPPKPYIMVMLTDQNGDGFKPIENSEEGAQIRDEHNAILKAKDQANEVANQLMADLAQNSFSDSNIKDAARLLKILAKS